ncbi:MAG: hypothetical protein IT426_17140 [Pirellulales bacterium]|nr:hypothetical protein [Pirellulales bacterium]
MKKVILSLVVMFCMAGLVSASINVDVYSGHTTVGGGAPYSGLVGTFTSPDILFATSTGFAWHPFGLSDFGAELTGCLSVASDATYSFTLASDDGSLLFIDGILVVDNGGPHPPATVSSSAILTAGLHSFKVQFFEDFGGPSGVDLYLPSGVTYAECPVPEPATIVVWSLLGAIGLAYGWWRRRTG